MINGLFALPWWGYIIMYLLLTHVTAIATSIFLHRNQAHRALNLHPALSHFFRFWLWLTTGIVTKQWTAVHRKHHAFCETEDDPHSPQIKGIKAVFFGGYRLYIKAAAVKETIERYGHGTPDDWLERHVYTPFPNSGLYLMLAINILLFGLPGILLWGTQLIWTPIHAAGIINGICHYWGYRNFETKDASTNLIPWGILIAGEELHNNHHTYPTSAKFSVKPWEFDISWGYIKLFAKLGLIHIKRIPPELHMAPEKHTIDLETVKALLVNRFQVLAKYSKEVIAPVFKEVRKDDLENKKYLTRKIKRLLVCEDKFVTTDRQKSLLKVLAQEHRLQVVYYFRKQLQAIWEKSSGASPKELIDSLQVWCKHAEQTGIKALQDFVTKLHTYTLTPKAET